MAILIIIIHINFSLYELISTNLFPFSANVCIIDCDLPLEFGCPITSSACSFTDLYPNIPIVVIVIVLIRCFDVIPDVLIESVCVFTEETL